MANVVSDLVGRSVEVGLLKAELAAARAGTARFVFIEGEAGIGKTRLCDAVSATARDQGVVIAWGRCWETGGAPAYWPWTQALRSLERGVFTAEFPKLGADEPVARSSQPDFEHARFALFDSVARFISSGDTSLLIILDDVHCADVPSLLLLRFLARSLRDARVLVVCTHRDPSIFSSPEVASLINEISRDAHTISLHGLSLDETASLISRASRAAPSAAVIERVHALTDGNPFFIDEVVRLMGNDEKIAIPQSVRATITSRLSLLPEATRRILATASVAGRECSIELLRRVTDESRSSILQMLEPAEAARLIHLDHPRVWFTHALVLQTLYASIPTMERARLHRRFAESLDEPDRVSETAHHWLCAVRLGDRGPAVDYAERAANEALAMLAFEDAVEHFKRALEALDYEENVDAARRCRLMLSLADARWKTGDVSAARETFDRAADLARAADSGALLARAALGAGQLYFGGVWARAWGPDGDLVRLLEEALSKTDDPELRARLLARLGADFHFSERRNEGIRLTDEALNIAESIGDDGLLAYCLTARHNAIWSPDTVLERLAMADRMVSLTTRLSNLEMTMTALVWRQTDLLELGRVAQAEVDADAYIRRASESKREQYAGYAKLIQSARAKMQGDIVHALALSSEASEIGAVLGDENLITSSATQIVQTAIYRDTDAASVAISVSSRVPILHAVESWVQAYAGHADKAREALAPIVVSEDPVVLHLPLDAFFIPGLTALANISVELEHTGLAHAVMRALTPYAHLHSVGGRNGVLRFGPVTMRLGMAAMTARDERAHGWLMHALAESERWGSPLWVAESLLALGRLYAITGERRQAQDTLDRCIEIARRFGMSTLERLALEKRPSLTGSPAGSEASLTREGDYWTVSYEGSLTRLRTSRGLEHLAKLLSAPASAIHALDLLGAAPVREALKHDAIPVLDEEAKRAYKHRVAQAQAELDEARAFNDEGRIGKLQHEIDAILSELNHAIGLGGRDRVSASASERARIAVGKSIRSAVAKITKEIPSLGDHLEQSVKTGTSCSYEPSGFLTWQITQ